MLNITNISKKFPGNEFYSLRDISLEIQEGEIVGLIGKNGAGKSTLMKLIAKSLKPSSGIMEYKGIDINSRDNVLDDFGIMIDPVFFPEMTVIDNLKFYLKLHNKENLYGNIETTLRLVELWDARNRKPKGFSFGMKQRTALAIALVSEPNFLILDEPFVGLDPIGVKKLINILKKWSSERQISMLISSHQLSELEELCGRYIYLEDGKLANSFDSMSHSHIMIHLDRKKEIDLLLPMQSENIGLVNNILEISTSIDNKSLNQLFKVLGENQLVDGIAIKENQLREIFTEEIIE
ncbi:ABC transporter ATP-binding protein [Streptococcus pluranimalium]|uniref:ABC transporter ATP-binding protein n=1 Tax=Streptococcus pluranimalium TaxID=82348 RepID=UPI0039FC4548